MDKLKPCPFCGGKALVRSVDGGILPSYIGEEETIEILDTTPYVVSCVLYCDSCGARVEGYAASSDLNDVSLYDNAIDDCYRKWNRRENDG